MLIYFDSNAHKVGHNLFKLFAYLYRRPIFTMQTKYANGSLLKVLIRKTLPVMVCIYVVVYVCIWQTCILTHRVVVDGWPNGATNR